MAIEICINHNTVRIKNLHYSTPDADYRVPGVELEMDVRDAVEVMAKLNTLLTKSPYLYHNKKKYEQVCELLERNDIKTDSCTGDYEFRLGGMTENQADALIMVLSDSMAGCIEATPEQGAAIKYTLMGKLNNNAIENTGTLMYLSQIWRVWRGIDITWETCSRDYPFSDKYCLGLEPFEK